MEKRNMLSVIALSIMMCMVDSVHAIVGRSKKMQQTQSGENWRAEKQAFWQKIGALADLDLTNEENVDSTLQTLKDIVAKKMNYIKKAKPGRKHARLQSKIDTLNKVIAELKLNTPQGKEKAQQLLKDFYTKHKEHVMKRNKGSKVTSRETRKVGKPGTKKRPGRRKRPVQPVGRIGQQGIIQPVTMPFAPSAPPAEDVLVSETEWLSAAE